MTHLLTPTADQRTAQKAKQHVNAMLRSGVRCEVLRLAWQALAETVRKAREEKVS
jgi:hypothetical protein